MADIWLTFGVYYLVFSHRPIQWKEQKSQHLERYFTNYFTIIYLFFSFILKATSWLGLAMVSVVRCAGVWTNNKCCLLDWTKTIISLTWLLPMTNITYFLTLRWSSEEHVRTGYICWFFCGVKEMLHVSTILSKFIRCQHEPWIYESCFFFHKTMIGSAHVVTNFFLMNFTKLTKFTSLFF